jgi:NAD(P)-dependent dehydrogenase (short-subunit alcohol dehydrogenase family)
MEISEMGRIANKITLITGTAQGLGVAIAELLAREGTKVILTDINVQGVCRRSKQINAQGSDKAIALEHDVSREYAWQQTIEVIRKKLDRLDILINNADIESIGSVEDETYENWRHVHAIDLDSVLLGCKYSIPLLADNDGGSIVNVSSISGIITGHNLAAYNSAKAAVWHLTKSVALHCAHERNNIRCNSVHPVFIDTPILDQLTYNQDRKSALDKLGNQIPLGHVGRPDDVAYALLYLTSDESAFVTGSEIKIDGGINAM